MAELSASGYYLPIGIPTMKGEMLLSPSFHTLPFLAARRERAAALLDISPSTFDSWIKKGLLPAGTKVDGVRLWYVPDLVSCFLDLQNQGQPKLEGDEDSGKNPFDDIVG